jgi:lipoprotein-anchoring transpeptidase ErfK/SrfK
MSHRGSPDRSARSNWWSVMMLPLMLVLVQPAGALEGQSSHARVSMSSVATDGGLGEAVIPEAMRSLDGRHVRISLREHRLYVMEGERVVWSTPVGTGTGERLSAEGRNWVFSTPRGTFRVQRKELDPVWNLPDWVFVKRGEPIPPPDSPARRMSGMLGEAAIYISRSIAIHGTDQPQLLGNGVSHGCIRVSNEDILRLYEELEVGTPVIIS